MLKHRRQFNSTLHRDGISIIEVLTSMAVATIGVFGVMVMIPFAVKQSQTGLDNDAASALGRNALEDLQTNGFLIADQFDNLDRIAVRVPIAAADNDVDATILPLPPNRVFELYNTDFPGEPVLDVATGAFRYNRPGIIHFDPIGVASDLTEVNIPDFPSVLAPDIRIYSATARRAGFADLNANGTFEAGVDLPAGGPVTIREASRLCRSSDELFQKEETESVEETAPPQPLFNMDGTNQIKRQFSGRISWSAFLVPEKDPGITGLGAPVSRFRSYAIAYRDRFIDPSNPIGSNYEVYLTNMSVPNGTDGFQQSVSQITFDAGNGVDTEEVGRGSWVMLLNRIPDPDTSLGGTPRSVLAGGRRYRAAAGGYRLQPMFARVTRVSDDGLSITIDGGAFDFVPAGIDAGNGNPLSSETYMFHLKNVVNVFERSISIEN